MSIETADFAVRRGGATFKCKGSDLLEKLTDWDLLLVNRGGVDYYFQLEDQGKLKLIKDVDFEFNDAGSIVITQNAEAKGGDTPYELKTDYDLVLGQEILSEPLPDRIPVAADVLNGEPYISFGTTNKVPASTPQEIYSLFTSQGEYIEECTNQIDGNYYETNNRYGLKASTFQGKQIIINVYNASGGDGTQLVPGQNSQRFIYFGLDETYDTGFLSDATYAHLHEDQDSACCGFVTDKEGNYYSAWWMDGLYQHKEVPANDLGYPDFTSTSIVTTKLTGPDNALRNEYYKGLAYHEATNSILYSSGQRMFQYRLDTKDKVTLNDNLPIDDSRSCVLSFTAKYVIRSIIDEDGSIYNQRCGELGVTKGDFSRNVGNHLFVNDPDNKYLFKIESGKKIQECDYNYSADPFGINTPWFDYRPEPMPSGEIGGCATIILEPFNLMWYQNGALNCWGSIPDKTKEVTVNQTITDAKGDSVSSSKTKKPL